MGQVLHGCARTTAAVRRAIQSSQESLIGRTSARMETDWGGEKVMSEKMRRWPLLLWRGVSCLPVTGWRLAQSLVNTSRVG
jgi:hypothetical protein